MTAFVLVCVGVLISVVLVAVFTFLRAWKESE